MIREAIEWNKLRTANSERFHEDPPEGHKKLAAELIGQAFKELRFSLKFDHRSTWQRFPSIAAHVRPQKSISETLCWFNSRETTPLGYGWCLGLSGLNPNVIRRSIDRILREGRWTG